jgi:predicted RNA-binding Zn ribbon-like protein
MVPQVSRPWRFHLSGGRLCLDFANTVSWRASGRPIDRLAGYGDLIAWGRQTRLLSAGDAARLAREAARRPAAVGRVLAEARALRETIYRLFRALAEGRAAGAAELASLNRALAEAARRRQVIGRGKRFVWTWRSEEPLRELLWPVVHSAAELLTSAGVEHLRTCASPRCGWVFLDTSRNRQRRWCDMRVCGNRAKARRFYARQSSGPRAVAKTSR